MVSTLALNIRNPQSFSVSFLVSKFFGLWLFTSGSWDLAPLCGPAPGASSQFLGASSWLLASKIGGYARIWIPYFENDIRAQPNQETEKIKS